MKYNNVELNVHIKGKPITEYPHMGQVFVEGRDGSNFEVVVKNHNPFTVEAVVSVDGLSVTDGKDAGPTSSGYLLKAGETVSIPGWKLDNAQVAAFQFAGKSGSYVAQSTGSARNTGVIGLLVYAEKPVYRHPIRPLTFAAQQGYNGMPPGVMRSAMASPRTLGTEIDLSSHIAALNCVATAAVPKGMDNMMVGAAIAQNAAASAFDPAPAVEQQLGTAFGQATDFATTEVSFNRGDMHAMLVLYYDNARALKARGIDLSRRAKQQATQTPNAFPGMSGCTPPAGWTR